VITDRSGTPLATSGPTGYGPAEFHGAYELPTTASTPQTIAIVDAYDSPTIESDLGVYSATYGLPACTTANGCFQKVNQKGAEGPYPKADGGWALEIALDVETAHAICQNCKILLVEASSNLFSDLIAAVKTAASLGATEISNSYGGGEYAGEAGDTSYKYPGIAVTASAGDSGYGAEYPASSPYVVAVGGTTLSVGPGNAYGGETVWSGSGSGCSAYAPAQAWQTSDPNWALTGCGTKRGVADVAADANPSTGASVYDTTKYQGQSGWFVIGGTSLSAPLIAAVYALAGGGSADYPAANPYSHQADSPASLHDVTSGSNGSCEGSVMCKGASGYDGPTGAGTPKGIAAFGAGGVDITPPQTTIDSGPAGPTNDPTPSFAFSSSEPGSTFQCRIDSESFAACSSPYTSAPLAEGSHIFEVRATDAATNTDLTPASRSFSVDTGVPASQASSPASANAALIAVAYTASDSGSGLASVELWVDPPGAGGYSKAATDGSPAGSDSFAYTAAAGDGTYSFYTRALDKAGNYEAAPASADSTTTLDTSPPQTSIESGPSGLTADPSPSFAFSSSEPGSTFQCRIDSESLAACSSPYTAAALGDGAHTFEVRAKDGAGNTDPSPAARSFTIDTAGPISAATAPTSTASTAITVSYTASDSGSGLASVELWAKPPGAGSYSKASTDSSPSASDSFAYSAAAGDGTYSFYTRALDKAGNYEAAPASADSTTTLDTSPPEEPPPPEEATDPPEGETTPPGTVSPPESTFLAQTPLEPATALASPAPTFRFGRVGRGERRDTMLLTVRVSAPGTLVLFGGRVRKVRRAVVAGTVVLPVRLKHRFSDYVGPARVGVAYTPQDASAVTKSTTITFG
jgi:hypothetical protein